MIKAKVYFKRADNLNIEITGANTMLNHIKHIGAFISLCSLCACSSFNSGTYSNNPPIQSYPDTSLYPEGYENTGGDPDPQAINLVSVPESYHLGAYHPPAKHTDVDSQWVNSQNSTAYTIAVAQDTKASSVANTLLTVPKNERMAEIKYQQGSETVYKGIYGSYPTKEAAEQALNALPDNIKQQAHIESWDGIQKSVKN